ncbi:MAG: hypothetical protein EOO50_00200 [Flavobacterium sp.]|uniref:hypothetical protein n=1 Tax=Flavobacterium sp. TaxID=239 RepID=UPI001213FA35|nr:hypothetical protein [Flavobacterium sp.]RZJ68636.1 MAG: hypothetical protein EOO50_00200 [Flavobacterium sp.]
MRSLKVDYYYLILLLFIGVSANAQFFPELQPKREKTITYLFFGVSIPLRHHLDGNAKVDNMRFLPDGINTKFGAGIHINRWFASGLHTGTEYRLSEKLVAIPVYMNLRFAPEVNEDTRVVVQPGFGYAIGIGHGNLSGYYGKVSVGIEELDGVSYYVEYSQYGFSRDDTGQTRAVSFGLGLTIF